MSPIKYRDAYPQDWAAIALAVKEACDWTCQACGRHCTRPGEPFAGATRMLTVAHLDPHSYDQEVVTVAALCCPCHLRYDAPYGQMFRRRHRQRRQRQAGQLGFGWAA